MEPLRRTTWGEKGKRPILKCLSRGAKLSVCGALVLNPQQTRLRELILIQERNYDTWDMVKALAELRREVGRDLLVIWDNLSAHRKIARAFQVCRISGIKFEFLPPYAPELNPVEGMWSQSKYGQLANFAPADKHKLKSKVQATLQNQQTDQGLMRSFFVGAELPLPPANKRRKRCH